MWTRLLLVPAAHAGIGMGIIVLGMYAAPRWIGWLLVFGGLFVVGASLLILWVTYRFADYDHQHGPDKPCPLDKIRGRYFYSRSDFTDFPPSIVDSVDAIITTVRDVYASRTVAWLDPQQVRDVHRVAWDALRVLDKTRRLRVIINDPPCGAYSDDLVYAHSHLAEVDDTLGRVLTCLQEAVALVHAWDQKLAETQLWTQLRAELDTLSHTAINETLRRAESVPENIFAYVTAARDVTNAGPFAWERTRP